MDEWYWNPSRVISYQHGNPITEFPFFTFLYADLHAHLIALPVALLVVGWVVSVVQGRAWDKPGRRSWVQIGFGLLMGGLAIGALYPINLSDIYTYLPLGAAALIYAIWRYVDVKVLPDAQNGLLKVAKHLILIGLGVYALYALTQLIYQPYDHWYGQSYNEIRLWEGTNTPVSEYLTHWGLFLFILVSWMFYETIDWMATTPASALRKLEPYRSLIWGGVVITSILILALGINLYPEGLPPDVFPAGLGIQIAWFVLPLAIWSGALLLRPGMSDAKRIVLFFIGTGLVLTLMVELIVVSGDIGRMNTVFKFYFHTWTLFAVSSGTALGWLVIAIPKWSLGWRTLWQVILGFTVFSAALYPLLGGAAKIMDRMEKTAPLTLDGMTYMQYSTYHDEGVAMDLSQDYNAIRWMQDNVVGSPVIVEANSVEYHWGTRYTIYTGLPGVVGWNWHQRQQRTATPHDWVFERVDAVHEFYQTEDLQWTQDFIQMYDVSFIIFGQLEQAKYPGPGLEKFAGQEGVLWDEVFRDRDTVVYEVIGD
jgi:YYY domain-containing protein